MPWFAPNPSQDQLDFWQGRPEAFRRKISKWPHPNTPRINCRFRFKDTDPTLIPLASRYGLYYRDATLPYDPDVPAQNAAGWFDFEVRGDNHLGFTTAENSEGYTLEITLQWFELLQERQVPGVEFRVVFKHASYGDQQYWEEYVVGQLTNLWKYDMNTFFFSDDGNRFFLATVPFAPATLQPAIFAVPECELFPFLPPEMASLNGIDAYIKLQNLMVFTNTPFKLSCEVRLNQTVNHWPILGRDGVGGFFGMEGPFIVFGFLKEFTSWTPVQDVWLTWVYEFEPVTQLQHKLTIAGNVVEDSTRSRQNITLDTIGVYKHGVSGTLWADMDIRDLKIEQGTPGNYTTLLDMPLRENALDLGPQANHGTTFNMPLPSV